MLLSLKEHGRVKVEIAIWFIVISFLIGLIVLLVVGVCKLFPSIQC